MSVTATHHDAPLDAIQATCVLALNDTITVSASDNPKCLNGVHFEIEQRESVYTGTPRSSEVTLSLHDANDLHALLGKLIKQQMEI